MRGLIYFSKFEKNEETKKNRNLKPNQMNKLKGVIAIVGIIVKYGAVVTAIIKGIQVVSEELEKIDFNEEKQTIKDLKNE